MAPVNKSLNAAPKPAAKAPSFLPKAPLLQMGGNHSLIYYV